MRLEQYGGNIIDSGDKVSPWKILLDKVHNLIVYLLIGSIIISFIMGDVAEGIAIIIAVFIAVFFGFFTELRAQKSMEALQNMIHTKVKVYRSGELKEINSSDLVWGDLIQIESGDALTADGRLLESTNFSVMEASLTGESQPVDKDAEFISEEKLSLGDRINQVFAGTAATRGTGKAVVTHTGMKTEVGKISKMMKEGKESGSPLDRELHKMGKYLIIFAAISAVIVAGLGILRGDPAGDIIHIALILAVSAIPEAMPAVSTMTLARGMKQMAKRDALVKTLSSVETLGSTGVICSDKTGTMTENEMTVTEIFLKDGKSYKVKGLGYDPEGSILEDGKEIQPEGLLKDFILSGILNNEAVLEEEEGEYKVNGDPTDGALLILGKKQALILWINLRKSGRFLLIRKINIWLPHSR